MLIFELYGITGIWVTNLNEDKKILHFDHQGIFLEEGNGPEREECSKNF